MEVTITVNGTAHTLDIEPRELLVHVLREELRLTGTHIGCDSTSCGACTVLYDGTPVKSCTVFGVQADGVEITTVEGLLTARASIRCRPRSRNTTDCSAASALPA